MATTAPNPAPSPDALSDSLLEFPDNRLLIDLCGELDRNIVQIEAATGVAIHRRGNHLALHGPAPDRALAQQVLQTLYGRLEQGRAVAQGEIDAAALRTIARDVLDAEPDLVTDYIAVVEPDRLAPAESVDAGSIVAIAARLGATRLIDNVILGDEDV